MPDRDLLSLWEEVTLLSIWELKDNAYGVAIRKSISRKTGRFISYGNLYFLLAQVTRKGFALKNEGDPTPLRGGRRKYFYTLTEKGKKALRTSYEFQTCLWRGVKKPVFD